MSEAPLTEAKALMTDQADKLRSRSLQITAGRDPEHVSAEERGLSAAWLCTLAESIERVRLLVESLETELGVLQSDEERQQVESTVGTCIIRTYGLISPDREGGLQQEEIVRECAGAIDHLTRKTLAVLDELNGLCDALAERALARLRSDDAREQAAFENLQAAFEQFQSFYGTTVDLGPGPQRTTQALAQLSEDVATHRQESLDVYRDWYVDLLAEFAQPEPSGIQREYAARRDRLAEASLVIRSMTELVLPPELQGPEVGRMLSLTDELMEALVLGPRLAEGQAGDESKFLAIQARVRPLVIVPIAAITLGQWMFQAAATRELLRRPLA